MNLELTCVPLTLSAMHFTNYAARTREQGTARDALLMSSYCSTGDSALHSESRYVEVCTSSPYSWGPVAWLGLTPFRPDAVGAASVCRVQGRKRVVRQDCVLPSWRIEFK